MCTIVSDTMLNAWTHTNIFNFQKNNQKLCPRTQNWESKKIKRPGQVLKLQRDPVSTNRQTSTWEGEAGSIPPTTWVQLHCPPAVSVCSPPARESLDSGVYYMPGTLLNHLGWGWGDKWGCSPKPCVCPFRVISVPLLELDDRSSNFIWVQKHYSRWSSLACNRINSKFLKRHVKIASIWIHI